MTCCTLCFRKKATPPTKQTIDIDEEVSGIQSIKIYAYKDLQIATEDFSAANKIGKGGFGSVYKGILNDGTFVAIKVLSPESKQGLREFLTEITVISHVDHENLVKLYGCCVERDHRILVYGYLENNSLAHTLLGNSQPVLNMKAKFHKFKGYLAPEYALGGQLTRKADVYSFGVLLLEIVSGRCCIDKLLPVEDQYLLERAWGLYERGELVELVDPSSERDFNPDEACRYLKVGLLCVQEITKARPSMSMVVKMLTGEMDVDEKGLLKQQEVFQSMDLKRKKNNASFTSSSGLGKRDSSSSSENTAMTQATLDFTSMYDRSEL
ncbi:hypothetical protein RJ639_007993 [Escallonia herrerae]|uniref:Protein kinase domain-containing protein n=1 Tax=Escallonia herrerae TaxID=1293975 RepID=A0AA88VP74_9ASTE|nr:hypothetical protein RJ639_007993 [Escallonia herrerae]